MRAVLFIIALAGNILVIPLVNHIHPVILSMPFFLFWILIWMIITPILTYLIYRIDKQKAKSN